MNRKIAVNIFPWGKTEHAKGDFFVDQEFYERMRDSFEHIARRKLPPVLINHNEDGFIHGKVLDIFTVSDGTDFEVANPDDIDDSGIFAVAELSPALFEAWGENKGNVGDWSPSFIEEFKDRHSDKVLRNFLRELSVVSIGHLYGIKNPSPAYSLSDDGFVLKNQPPPKESAMMDEEKNNQEYDVEGAIEALSGQVGALIERLDEMGERLKAMEEGADEEEAEADGEEDVDAMDEPEGESPMKDRDYEMSDAEAAMREQIIELRDKLHSVEVDRQREKARAKVAEMGLSLSDKERNDLVQLACDNPEGFVSFSTMLKKREQERKSAASSDKKSGYMLGEVGAVGNTEASAGGREKIRKLACEIAEGVKLSDANKKRAVVRRELTKAANINWGDERQAGIAVDVLDSVAPKR